MPLGFAVVLFAVAGFSQFVRDGGLVASPLGGAALVGAAMVVAALLLIGRETPHLLLPTFGPNAGDRALSWSWARTARLMILVPLAFIVPGLCTASVVPIQAVLPTLDSFATALGVQILLFAVPQELFFREAALRAFRDTLGLAFALSALATLVFFLPLGLAGATLAAASGVVAMALRVMGMNIFAVAIVQGLSAVLFGRVFVAQVDETSLWLYTAAFCVGCLIFTTGVLLGRRVARRWPAQWITGAAR